MCQHRCGKHRCHGYHEVTSVTTVGVVVVCVNIGVDNIAVTDIMRSPVWTTVGVVVVCVNIGVDIAVTDIMRSPVWTL